MARTSIQNANASLYTTGASASKLSTPIVPSPTGFSFGLWLKPLMVGGSTFHYMSYNSAAFTDGVIIARGAGKANVEVNIYNAAVIICAFNSLSNTAAKDSWIHIAVTYLPSGTCNLYFNGSLKQTLTSSGTMSVAAAQTLVFGNRSYADAPNGCNLSNIVWQNTTTSWTNAQVLDLYNGKAPAGTTMVLPLNEGAGSIAYDTSGNGNNGTITSGTWTRDTPSKTRKTVNGNLVYNGDFEIAPVVNVAQTTASSNWLDGTSTGSTTNNTFGWRKFNYTGSQHAYFDSTEKYLGQYSLRLSTLGTGATIGVTNATQATLDPFTSIPCTPSTAYTLKFWMKTNVVSGSATSGAFLRISAGNVSDSTKVKTTTDWTQYTVTVTTGGAISTISIEARIIGNDGAGTLIMDAWFDDITLTPTTPTTRTATTGPYRKTVENLVTNGDFEYAPAFTAATTSATKWIDGTAGSANTESPYGWWTPGSFTASATAQFDTTVCHSGTTSLKLSTLNATGVANAASGNNNTSQTIQKTVIRALPGTSYTLTGWVKTNNANTNSVYLDVIEYGGNNSFIASTSTNKLSGTNDWTQLTTTFTTSAVSTRYILIVLRNAVAGNISDAYFDDIVLTKTTPDARSAA